MNGRLITIQLVNYNLVIGGDHLREEPEDDWASGVIYTWIIALQRIGTCKSGLSNETL